MVATKGNGLKQKGGTLLCEYFSWDLDRFGSFELVLNFSLLRAQASDEWGDRRRANNLIFRKISQIDKHTQSRVTITNKITICLLKKQEKERAALSFEVVVVYNNP